MPLRRALAVLLLLLAVIACSAESGARRRSATTTTRPPPPPVTVVAAADVASCFLSTDEASAEVVERYPDATVIVAGDLAYDHGSAEEFERCYNPSWGRFKDRTRPAPGNHEYLAAGAAPYFAYFGAAAGAPGKGWYSFDVGAWHVVSLNSNLCPAGCGPDSEQGQWLARDLASSSRVRCTMAFWHHPPWSSGQHGSQAAVAPLWAAVAAGGVDVVLSGHDHDYERFAEIDGVRPFVIGTGGASRYNFRPAPAAGSEVRGFNALGVLVLTLRHDSYRWEFANAETGNPVTDYGDEPCS